MDNIRKIVVRNMRILAVALIVVALINAYDSLGPGFPVNENVNEHIFAFQHGIMFGLMLVLTVFLLRYILALRNEKQLKKFYLQMTDERMAMVRMKSGAPVMLGCAIVLIVASMAAMYINTTVSITLIACSLFLLLVAATRKLVLRRMYTGNQHRAE